MWSNPQEASDLVTFTETIFNGKLRFLCSVETGPEPRIFGFQAQVALLHMYSQSSQHMFSITGKTDCHFSGSSWISSKVKQNSSSRFKLQSRSVILTHITTKRFQNQYKLSLKNSKLANGNVEIICSIEINSLWCNIFASNNLTKS